jgi:hypothetical protein
MSTFVGDTIYTHVFSFLYLKGLSRATYKVIELVKTRTVWPNMCDDKRNSTLNTAELLPNMCDNHQWM